MLCQGGYLNDVKSGEGPAAKMLAMSILEALQVFLFQQYVQICCSKSGQQNPARPLPTWPLRIASGHRLAALQVPQ